jgi:hypothetical protein
MQPGKKAAFTPETVQLLPGPHKRLLQKILRQSTVTAAQAPDQTVYPVAVALIKLLECQHIPAPGQINQLQILIAIVDWFFFPRHDCC